MAQEITLPMDGMLLNWLKQVGDSVSKGEIIAEFEADKATVEVEAPDNGVILELITEIGQEVEEGSVIARLGAARESAGSGTNGAPAKSAPAPAPTAPQQATSNGAASYTDDGRIKASPLARRMAEDRGIALNQVPGSGPGGRITKTDVETFDPATIKKPAAPIVVNPIIDGGDTEPAAPATAFQSYGKVPEGSDVEVTEMNRMRKAIAKGTITSINTTPHFYVTMEVDVSELLKVRKQLNDPLAEQNIKITVNDMLVKAVALTLRQFPNLNSHYYGDKVVRHKRINVAIAVSLPNNGLANVVSPDADKTSLSAMATYHKEMFDHVREGKIKPEYIQGGTFLVSNLGAYGVESFSAIIDPPQSGALAVGAAQLVPVVQGDGSLGVSNRMKVTLSVDHRVSDGAEGAQFLQYFKGLVENPMRLLV